MRSVDKINLDIQFYTAIRDRAQKERRFRTVEGAQWNIDRCRDELIKLRNSK